MTPRRKMDPDLMCPPRFRGRFDERRLLKPLENPNVRHGRTSRTCPRRHLFALDGMASDRGIDRQRIMAHHPTHHRDIALDDRARRELPTEMLQGRRRTSDHHHARRQRA